MRENHTQLINFLSISGGWQTSSVLAAFLGVSIRTIKKYVSEINYSHKNLITSSNKGYRINQDQLADAVPSKIGDIPNGPKERMHFIIMRMIKRNKISLSEIRDEIFVSESTLRSDMLRLKKKAAQFDLETIVVGDTATLVGLERNKRKIMSDILFSESVGNFLNIDMIQDAFKVYDFHYIEQMLQNKLRTFRYFINDYAMTNLLLHIVISLDRIINDMANASISQQSCGISETDLQLAKEIASELESRYCVEYSIDEVYELALLIASSVTKLDFNAIDKNNIAAFVGAETIQLVNRLIDKVTRLYYVDLDDSDFYVRFSLHIFNLLERIRIKRFTKNPLTESIKRSSPLIYDCAVSMSHEIKNFSGCIINDDEIAFIAFHIGGAIEMQKNAQEKLSYVLLLPQYYNFESEFSEKLVNVFGNDLYLRNIFSDNTNLDKVDADIIISTKHFASPFGIPTFVASPFFTEKEQNSLRNLINEVKNQKRKLRFAHYLSSVIDESMFECNLEYDEKDEAIEFMCERMLRLGYVNQEFMYEINEREILSSTAFGRIAIPHSMKMNALKTRMFVGISKGGIIWGERTVNVVLLISIAQSERMMFREVFDILPAILLDENVVSDLVRCQNYSEFKNIILDSFV